MTGKKLLEKGELQRRYTIIPLNRISARTLNDKVVNTAKNLVRELNPFCFEKKRLVILLSDPETCHRLFNVFLFSYHLHIFTSSLLFSSLSLSFLFCQVGKENVHTALSLVGYESDLRKAMEYVFGSTLVCDTLDNAKKVAFDKQVMTKTVTLGGDIFDPQGTLSGGEKVF